MCILQASELNLYLANFILYTIESLALADK